MLHERNRENQTESEKSAWAKCILAGMALKATSKARELCLAEFSRTRLIRHHKSTLRVCGNKSGFASQVEQTEQRRSVLCVSPINSSPSYMHSLNSADKSLTHTSAILNVLPLENPQHSFSLFSPFLSYRFATPICTGEAPFLDAKISSLFPIPEGCFFDQKNRPSSLQLIGLSACPSTLSHDTRRSS